LSTARQNGKPSAKREQAKSAASAAFKGSAAVMPDGVLRKSRHSIVAILAGILAVQVVSPATVILLVAGMLPSLVAYIVDTEPSRRSAHCMAVLNLSGVLPVLATLWDRGATRSAAVDILMDPFMWFLMYGAAGIAVLLLTLLPVMMEQLSNAAAEKEISRLEKQMSVLTGEWGDDLALDAGRMMAPSEEPADAMERGSARSHGRQSGGKSDGRGASLPTGAVQGRRPSSPSAASRKPGLRSGAPARG
jgi:hypothetical protein